MCSGDTCDRCGVTINWMTAKDNTTDDGMYCDKCFSYLEAMADIEMERQKEEE